MGRCPHTLAICGVSHLDEARRPKRRKGRKKKLLTGLSVKAVDSDMTISL